MVKSKIFKFGIPIVGFFFYFLLTYALTFIVSYIIYKLLPTESGANFGAIISGKQMLMIGMDWPIRIISAIIIYFILRRLGYAKKITGGLVVSYIIILSLIFNYLVYYQQEKYEDSIPKTIITDAKYESIIQREAGVIQTGDTIKFSWNGCDQEVFLYLGVDKYDVSSDIAIVRNSGNTKTYQWVVSPDVNTGKYLVKIGSPSCNYATVLKDRIEIKKNNLISEELIREANKELDLAVCKEQGLDNCSYNIAEKQKDVSIIITSPPINIVEVGSNVVISWNTYNVNSLLKIIIGIKDSDGKYIQDITGCSDKLRSDGKYTWKIPTTLSPGKYQFFISTCDGWAGSGWAGSNSDFFTIVAPN